MSTLREKRKKERRALRRRKTADWTVVLILCAIAVCCGGYLVYHHWSVKQRELEYEKLRQEETLSAATEAVIEEPETEESTEETVIYCDPVYDFGQLQEQNKDIYAWIVVPGTQVDYPVLQSETDNYYLDYNLDHSKGYPGCIYTNNCNQKDFADYNTIFYGHNMKNGSMFGSIHSFEDETFFEEHPYIYVYTENERFTYEIYEAAKFTDVYIPAQYVINSREDRDRFLNDVKETVSDNKLHVRKDLEVGEEDRLITLSTCVNGERNHRYLVIGVLVETAVYR
jgi:sortase B